MLCVCRKNQTSKLQNENPTQEDKTKENNNKSDTANITLKVASSLCLECEHILS